MKAVEPGNSKYLTTRALSELIDRTEGAVRQMVFRHQLPYRKVNGRVVFLRAEIEKLIEEAPGVRLSDLNH